MKEETLSDNQIRLIRIKNQGYWKNEDVKQAIRQLKKEVNKGEWIIDSIDKIFGKEITK